MIFIEFVLVLNLKCPSIHSSLCHHLKGAILTTMLVSRNFNSKNLMSKKSDGSQVKESTDSSATMDEDEATKGKTFIFTPNVK